MPYRTIANRSASFSYIAPSPKAFYFCYFMYRESIIPELHVFIRLSEYQGINVRLRSHLMESCLRNG